MKLTIAVEQRSVQQIDNGAYPYHVACYEGTIYNFEGIGIGDADDVMDAIGYAIGDWEKQTGKEI
jgi:hypothetical protein